MKRPRYFQWLQGENIGTVSQLDFISEIDGEFFYNFKDGEVCNQRFISKMTKQPSEIKDKFMVEIASPSDPWVQEKITTGFFKNAENNETVDVPPLEDIVSASGNGANVEIDKSKLGTIKFQPPRYSGKMLELPSLDDYLMVEEAEPIVTKTPVLKTDDVNQPSTQINTQPVFSPEPQSNAVYMQQPQPNPAAASTSDPVRILAKTCKKRDTTVDVQINIQLPSRAIYNLASSEFENGGESFINYLIEDIDINLIISALRDGLVTAYKSDSSEND